jgi:hypothetical protein
MGLLAFLGPQEIILILIATLIVVPVFLIIPLIALIDILKSKFEGNDKLIWVLVVLFLGVIGAALYLFIGRKQKLIDK